MMDKLQKVLMLLLLAVISFGLSGCGGEDAFSGGDDPVDPGGSANVASVLLLTSSPSMGTSSTSEVTLTAQVKDSNNNLLEGESVIFTANGGALAIDSATSNASGIASARLSPAGDPSNRTITVSALAGTVSGSVTVAASGTVISISGETAVVLNDTTILTIFLADSKGVGIPGELLTVSSANGNTISATSLSTDSSGNISIALTGNVAGTDTITVTALGGTASQTQTVSVSGDEFTVTLPAPATDLAIGSAHTVTATWKINNVAVANGTVINFSSTRGTLSAPSATTTAGVATVTVSSTTAGPVSITASSTGPSASAVGEFVAILPETINIQAEADTMGPNGQQNTITAVVRDLAGNFVKNIPIRFSIVQDTSGGSISNATAVTDSLGRAATVYTSTAATTAKDGVVIKAEIDGTPAKNDSIAITVGQSELFVRLGTSNLLTALDDTRYKKTYNVLVTDAGGAASVNTSVTLTLIPTRFYKGERLPFSDGATPPVLTGPVFAYPTATCLNEDSLIPATSFNGVLDLGEDLNGNGTLEPGNVASVSGTVLTDATGFALIDVIYSKDFASWTEVKLRATALVAGSEGSDEVTFTLPVLAADIQSPGESHPGDKSPFGYLVANCNDPT